MAEPVQYVDPTGPVITELRTYLIAHGYPNIVVKGDDFLATDKPTPVPSTGPTGGAVLVRKISGAPRRRVGLHTVRYVLQSYSKPGPTGKEEADKLAFACVAAMHDSGPRVHGKRPLFSTHVVSYGGTTEDPDLHWPRSDVFLEVLAAKQPLP